MKEWYDWLTTRPQAYLSYAVALLLVLGLSFLAGTFRPKHLPPGMAPPVLSQPHN
jgi:hypothetical protein